MINVPIPKLVQVQFESRRNPGTYSGGAYTYIADVELAVGDVVKVPTKYGDSAAKVCRVDVPIGEIQCRVGELKRIAGPVTAGDIFAGFFD